MCRCCQSCLEDCYWSCFEEKFCYDETIAHFDPDEDEYETKKSANNLVANLENNNSPICEQPRGMQNTLRTVSSKCHQDELRREIQTTVPILAPEILAVFANSKIFHDDAPLKSPMLAAVHKSGASKSASVKIVDPETDKLLKRLEGTDTRKSSEIGSYASLPKTRIRIITEEEAAHEAAVISRSVSNPKFNHDSAKNKRILQLQPPFFSARPASENDIFTIASEYGRISTTPEVPSVSFANLPKNYLETPTLEQYRESVSLYEIQSTGAMKKEEDYSMPRYYRKSKLIVPAVTQPEDTIVTTPKNLTVSKRLQAIRTNLPPLRILSKEKVNETNVAPVHHM